MAETCRGCGVTLSAEERHYYGASCEACEAKYAEGMAQARGPRTVKVRIAVAISRDGQMEVGIVDYGDESYREVAMNRLGECFGVDAAVVHDVAATLPVPEPVEVEGVVEDEDASDEIRVLEGRC